MSVHVFPGNRHNRMINRIAEHMAQLGDLDAEKYLVWHFDVEWDRLTEYGVAEEEIEFHIVVTARAIWSLMYKIQAGAA
jgi:hypothetical protein